MNLLDNFREQCPYCGERIELSIDASVARQAYTEDCQVCCRPMVVAVSVINEDVAVSLHREDD